MSRTRAPWEVWLEEVFSPAVKVAQALITPEVREQEWQKNREFLIEWAHGTELNSVLMPLCLVGAPIIRDQDGLPYTVFSEIQFTRDEILERERAEAQEVVPA